jgi:hypothetical protein
MGARVSYARETRGPRGPLSVRQGQVVVFVPDSETSLTPERVQEEFYRLSMLMQQHLCQWKISFVDLSLAHHALIHGVCRCQEFRHPSGAAPIPADQKIATGSGGAPSAASSLGAGGARSLRSSPILTPSRNG